MKSLTTDQADQDRYREAWERLFDLTHDLLGSVGFNGRLKQVNPAWSRTLGWTEKELLETRWIESVHPEDRPAALAAGEELLAGKPVISLENRYQCRDGSYRRITWDSFPDMEKRLIMVVGRDITERRRAEESLRQSEETLRALLDGNPESLLLIDEQLTVITANRTAARRFGKGLDELIGANLNDLLSDDVLRLRKTYFDEVFRRGQPVRFKDTHRGRDFSTYAHPVLNAAGEVSRIAILGVDITERRRAEEALRKTEETYRSIFENAVEGIFQSTPEGRFISVNPAMARMFGYESPEELMADIADIKTQIYVDPQRRAEFQRLMARDGFVKDFEYQVYRKDGRDLLLSENARAVRNEKGDILYYEGFMQDVTERKEAEALSRNLIAKSPVGIYLLQDRKFVVTNRWFHTITGYGEKELSKLDFWQLVHPEDRSEVRTNAVKMLRGERLTPYEYRTITKTGETRWIMETVASIQYQGKRATLGYFMDITERKRAEDKFREQLIFQQALMDTIPSPIFYKNVEGIYLGCNKALGDFLGLTKEEIIGKSVYDISPKDLADKYFEMDSALFRQPGVQIYDFSTIHADGSRKDVTYYKATYSAIDGTLAGLVGVMMDITHRKRAEEALRESEQKLANIIDFLPDATLVIDNEGKIIAWNKAMEEMTGVKAEDMVGKGNYEYALPFYGERRPILIDLLHKSQEKLEKYTEVKREGPSISAVVYFPTFKGREAYLFGKAGLLLDSKGNYAGAIESIRDITDLKKAEAERLRLDKLESLGLLAGGIAHDFNNILTAIIGNISLAMLNKKMERQVDERLIEAEKACLKAQTLARQLLTFAKGGAPVKKITSVATTIDESVMFACRGSKARCEIQIPDDLWCVEADPGQLGQVFQNLVINAVQAMPTGGTIDIHAENLRLKASRDVPLSPGKYVKVSLRDHGIGIPAEYLPKIFDPYFTTKQAGSGLGLATAFSIIKNHHGHISVESTMGVGTTFHIFLPASDQRMVPQPEPDRKALLGKGKILVMDDEEIVREVLGKMLAKLGYEAKFAQDGAEAVEKFIAAQKTGDKFEAVILDLTVPGGIGGKDTIRKLLDIDPQVKAIVSSGYSDNPIMANFKAYGFSGMIAKPYKVLDLSEVLHDIITNAM